MENNVRRDEMKKEEYECEFYGYTTGEAITELKDIISTAIEEQTDSLERSLLNHYKEPKEQSGIKKATDCFRSKCAASVAEGMQQVENVVHRMYDIPDHVLIPKDFVQRQQYTEEDEKQLDAATEQLMTRGKKALFLHNCLEEELHEIKMLTPVEAKLKEKQQAHEHGNELIPEEALKLCDEMVNAILQVKHKAEELGLMENTVDFIQEKFICL